MKGKNKKSDALLGTNKKTTILTFVKIILPTTVDNNIVP
jgi:hypothetical protein